MRRTQAIRTTLVAAVLASAVACLCLCPTTAHAQTPAADPAVAFAALREPVAALLFLDARTRQFLPASTAELRAAGEDAILAGAPGAVDRAAVQDLQRRHRVRSGLNAGGPFLTALRADLGARRLLVVDLLFDTGSVQAAGRLVDTADGRLLGAGTVEPETWDAETSDWTAAIHRAVSALMLQISRRPLRSDGQALVVLPVRARGFGRADAVTATHALLETVLADGRYALTDPGVVNHLLLESGHDPRRVDAAGMRTLADSLHAARLLAADLITYDSRAGTTPAAVAALDSGPARRAALPAFTCQIRLTDLSSGAVVDVATLFHDDRPDEGWFGIVHTRSTRSVLRDAAQRLWAELGSHTEASP